ncbi:MAG: hypothetical protein DWG83_00245 [Chloroflexi bacterium]|nr:hypothetical protein [Chloroflexota bacterium]MQC18989.1 hypothetical protein [Chloroflexota bacterium]
MNRMLARLAALTLIPIALVLSGCFNIENNYVVNEDGSGSRTIRFAIPAETLTGFGEELPDTAEMESDEEIAAIRSALGEMGEMRFFSSEEEGVGFELTMNVDASDDFAAALTERASAVQAALPPEVTAEFDMSMFDVAGEGLILRRDGDEWIFEVQAASLDSDAIGALTGDPEMGMMADFFMGETNIVTTIRLPGEVTEHNADEVREDGTLVWTQTGVSDERTMSARSDVGGGGLSSIGMAGLVIGAVALALGVVGFLILSRNRRAA